MFWLYLIFLTSTYCKTTQEAIYSTTNLLKLVYFYHTDLTSKIYTQYNFYSFSSYIFFFNSNQKVLYNYSINIRKKQSYNVYVYSNFKKILPNIN